MTAIDLSSTDAALSNPSGSKRCCKLIQISDLHLQQRPDQRYRDYDVEQQLLAVLRHIQSHHADLDALLLSGDLVHHGHAEGYLRLCGYLDAIGKPWYWIPGNHDELSQMQQILPASPQRVVINGWRLVLLDSCSEPDGCGSGSLAETELRRLAVELDAASAAKQPVLLMLHHNPVPLGSSWQDAIMLGNADALWALLDQYRLSVTLLSGHIHQQYDQRYRGARLLSCPSTAVQFKPQQQQLVLENDPLLASPGYRWLTLSFSTTDLFSAAMDQKNVNTAVLETGIERLSLA